MDPHLFDLLWEAYREVGGQRPIEVICGYRAAGTNAMLRARSTGVAQNSQHVGGKAIDFDIPGVTWKNSAQSACACSAAASASIRHRARPSSIWNRHGPALAAHDPRSTGQGIPRWPHRACAV